MEKSIYDAYKKDFQNGIVTVGNICSANCFFCSQNYNPPGVIQSLKRFLSIEEIKHFINLYLNKVKWIASGIHTNSGEFFLHPNAAEILNFLGTKKKLDGIGIFTNGMNLTIEHIKLIKKLNLFLYLSLNSANVVSRMNIMDGSYLGNRNAINSLEILDRYSVEYSVWVVPFNSALNNGDLENSIKYLKNYKCRNVKIHRPGYTKYTPLDIAKELAISDRVLLDFILNMRKRYKINITFEVLFGLEKIKIIFGAIRMLFNNKMYSKKRKLFLCSYGMKEIVISMLKTNRFDKYNIKVVKSNVFGGNVDCAGLLLVEDFVLAIDEFLKQNKDKKPEVLILPRRSFDINLEDLSMVSPRILETKYKTQLILI